MADAKIGKYLLSVRESDLFQETIKKLIVYLRSRENLYPSLESNILETLLLLPTDKYSIENRKKLVILANDILFKTNGYLPNSEYARALAILILFKLDNSKMVGVAEHYLKSNESNALLRKYLIFVSLTVTNQNVRSKVLDKAKKEHDLSINRLMLFVSNIDDYCHVEAVKRYIGKNKKVLCYKPELDLLVEKEFDHVRGRILKKLIDIYG